MERLSSNEYDVIAKVLHASKMDNSFDFTGDDNGDWFIDFENDEDVSLEEGLSWIADGIADVETYGLTEDEIEELMLCFASFNIWCDELEDKMEKLVEQYKADLKYFEEREKACGFDKHCFYEAQDIAEKLELLSNLV